MVISACAVTAVIAIGALSSAGRALAQESSSKPAPAAAAAAPAGADADMGWPQWRGPTRDGIVPTRKWSWKWPKDGPKRLWSATIGGDYGSIIAAKGRIFVFTRIGGDHVLCLDAETGKQQWDTKVGEGKSERVNSTPCTDGKYVFSVTSDGNVTALDVQTGAIVWQVNIVKEYNTTRGGMHGIANSPLLVGDALVLAQGVGLDKATGKLLWQNTDAMSNGHASPLRCPAGGNGVLVAFSNRLIRVDAASGKTLWQADLGKGGPNYIDPIVTGEQIVTVAGGGGRIFRFTDSAVEEDKKAVFNGGYGYFGAGDCANPVQYQGYLYAARHADADRSSMCADNPELVRSGMVCYDLKTLKKVWTKMGIACTPILCDGKLILQGIYGEIRVAEASPEGYKELAHAKIFNWKNPDPKGVSLGRGTASTPILLDGRIYMRCISGDSKGEVVCLDVSQDSPEYKAPDPNGQAPDERTVGEVHTIVGTVSPKAADMTEDYVLGILTEDQPAGAKSGATPKVYRLCAKENINQKGTPAKVAGLMNSHVSVTGTLLHDNKLTVNVIEGLDGAAGQPASKPASGPTK